MYQSKNAIVHARYRIVIANRLDDIRRTLVSTFGYSPEAVMFLKNDELEDELDTAECNWLAYEFACDSPRMRRS